MSINFSSESLHYQSTCRHGYARDKHKHIIHAAVNKIIFCSFEKIPDPFWIENDTSLVQEHYSDAELVSPVSWSEERDTNVSHA
jgi:hypothetical protein